MSVIVGINIKMTTYLMYAKALLLAIMYLERPPNMIEGEFLKFINS